MSFSLLMTEFRRSCKNSLISLFLCFALGFVLVVSLNFKTYLEQLFAVPNWGAGVLILPKGLTPEVAYKNIINGEPDGLLPEALYETLRAQLRDEQQKQGLQNSPLEFMAFMPFQKDGIPSLGALDFKEAIDFFAKHDSMLRPIPLEDWRLSKPDVKNPEKFSTVEWKDKTFFAALANGSPEYLSQLMTLINRRTVAEAFYVDHDKSDQSLKLASLKSGLSVLSGFILVLALLGLFLSFEILAEQRRNIFLVLTELKVKKSVQTNFYIGQIFILAIVPASFGALAGHYFWPYLKFLI